MPPVNPQKHEGGQKSIFYALCLCGICYSALADWYDYAYDNDDYYLKNFYMPGILPFYV